MANITSEKWKGVTGGGSFGQKSLFWLFRHCDVRVGYFFMYIAIPFYMLFGVKSRRAIMHYFRDVHGYGWWKSLTSAWKNYNTFGKVMLDRFSIFSGQKDKFQVECDGVDIFDELVKSSEGFMMAGSHTGNFEICGYLLHQDVKKIFALVFGGESAVLQQKRFVQFASNNIEMVPVTDDMSHLFAMNQALQDGNIITMPADRIFGSSKCVTCKFGNAEADFPVGPFSIAAIRNVPVIGVFVYKLSTRKYRIIVRKIQIDKELESLSSKKRAEAMAREYVKILESMVMEYPTQWFNFFEFFRKTRTDNADKK